MSDRLGLPAPTEVVFDLESALQLAHEHARIYGLWEVADDLDQIIRGMQARTQPNDPPPAFRVAPMPRRRT